MKKFFFKIALLLIAPSLVFCFFLIKILVGKVPVPADTLLGLYHPWRDLAIAGYSPGKFPTKNPLITDPVLQVIPWRSIAINDIKEGRWPLWNPYSFSGQPLLANVQSSPLSITNLLFFVLPFKIAWSLSVILPVLLTSLFMYLFLSSLNFSKVASIFGASLLPFTGFFVAWLTWGTVTTTAMWLPLIFFLIIKIFEKTTLPRFLILSFLSTQVLFSGHLQTAFYVFLASFIFAVWWLFKSKSRGAFLWILAAIILGITISAPQLLPAYEFLQFSARDLDQAYYPGREDWFIPLKHFIQLLAPDFFGNPATYNYWGVWNWAEFVSFVGIVPLGFALLAIFFKNKNRMFFVLLALVSLVLIIKNPLSLVPYTFKLPFFTSMQPSRAIFLLVFSLSALAAAGLDQFLSARGTKKIIWPAVLILLAILSLAFYTIVFRDNFPKTFPFDTSRVALRNLVFPLVTASAFIMICLMRLLPFPRAFLILGIFFLTLFELYRFAYKFTPFSKLSWLFTDTKTTTFLSGEKKPFRILATDRRIFHGNTPAFYQIEAVGGYDPLYLKDYAKLVTVWQSQRVVEPGSFNRIINPENYASKFADFLNVKYVLTFDEIISPTFEKILQEGETKVYQNKNAIERAFIVNQVIEVGDRDSELAKFISSDFDPKITAVSSEFDFPRKNVTGEISFLKYSDQSFEIKTNVPQEAPLIISNVYYPGWQAKIDGTKTKILRVNYMFQAVIIPGGNHTILFEYKPASFYNGLYISTVAAFVTLGFSVYLWRRQYR